MSKLELKIPPLLLTVIFAVLMWLVSRHSPGFQIPILYRASALAGPIVIGVFFFISSVLSFRRAKTTINPIRPDTCSALVTSGIYNRTRNPMYVGFLCCLIGWGIFLSNPYSLAFCAGFVMYLNRYQICAEENALENIFDVEYLDYKARVRRWL